MRSNSIRNALLLGASLLAGGPGLASQESAQGKDDAAKTFLAEAARRAAAAEKEGKAALKGRGGWLLLAGELRSIGAGAFWGKRAVEVSRAAKSKYADPLPAIVDFDRQLKKAGIELLLVPVPAKATVYPESVAEPSDGDRSRLDVHHRQFYGILRERGVQVLDLMPLFRRRRHGNRGALYCKTDAHWSGAGCFLASEAIFDRIKDRPWLKEVSRKTYALETRPVKITGDLVRMLEKEGAGSETVTLTFVGEKKKGRLVSIGPSRESPVVLMGDSHTLVFHDPGLHARGAGLADHLAYHLGVPVDLVGVRGSGATATRVTLLRRRDNMAGKKLVVWCFSVREFTESFSGWRKVPVIR